MSNENILSVTGTVGIRERLALPPGAVASIKLVDAEGEVLAGTAVELTGHPPAAFELRADPAFVADPDALFLWAALRSDVGTWGTVDLEPVTGDSIDVILTRIED